MLIKVVRVGCLFNKGNYENEKIELEAELQDGESVDDAVEELKGRIYLLADREEHLENWRRRKRELREMEAQVREARETWNKTRTFLVAQGLRPDAPEFPFPEADPGLLISPPDSVRVQTHAEERPDESAIDAVFS